MNEKKAKQLRRQVYGNMSIRKKEYLSNGGTVICRGLRKQYQEAKKRKEQL